MANYNQTPFTVNISNPQNFDLSKYITQVKSVLNQNLQKCLVSKYVTNKEGVFKEENFLRRFSITGSFITYDKNELEAALNFFKKEDRLRLGGTGKKEAFYTRGYRYLVALDPNLSVLQKLKVLFEDIQDGMDFIIQNEIPIEKQYVVLAPVLDYIKNAIVTLYNAYTHKEKLGDLDLNEEDYQANKQQLLELMEESVFAYYSALTNRFSYEQLMKYLKSFDQNTLLKINQVITEEYRRFTFSSRAIARPEASHPLILAGFAYNICKKYQETDIVVGLPSGGTELACLVHQHLRYNYNNFSDLVLLPISTHTTKDTYGLSETIYNKFNSLFDKFEDETHKSVLLIDDNSATGKSLEVAKRILLKKFRSMTLKCGVPEADLVRIKQNIEEGKKKITHRIIFSNSISILPISKLTFRKNDLKEVIESHVLSQYYYRKSKDAVNVVDRIKFEVIAEAISIKTERVIPTLNKQNSITEFKHTFLSNFYQTPIVYNGMWYASVEHAYLDQQYKTELLKNLNSAQRHQLNEVFKIKGMVIQHADFSKVFKEQSYPAGVVKRMSNIIKNWNIEVSDWENKRLGIMVELQLLKFSEPYLRNKLYKTEGKYLLEGNTWNDTYWGYCENRGRNFLGRILMKVREVNKEIVS